MLANRFDNLSTADLAAREKETRAELEAIVTALKTKMISECPVVLGRVHRIVGRKGYYGAGGHSSNGRKIIPMNIAVNLEMSRKSGDVWKLTIGGPMENKRSTTGTGYNRHHIYLEPKHFEPIEGPEGDAPDWAAEYVETMKGFVR